MSVAWVPNCSFAGTAFSTSQKEGPGWTEEIDDQSYVTATDIPGGDNAYVQVGGRKSAQWSREIVVPHANYAALKAKRGQQGTLTVHGVPYTATFHGLSGIRRRAGELAVCTGTWTV